jgi:hypothetical protein
MTFPGQQPGIAPPYEPTLPRPSARGRLVGLLLTLVALALLAGVGYGIVTTLRNQEAAPEAAATGTATTAGIPPIDAAVAAACAANKQAVALAVQAYLAQHRTPPQGADDRARIQVLVTAGYLRTAPPTDDGYQILVSASGQVSATHC